MFRPHQSNKQANFACAEAEIIEGLHQTQWLSSATFPSIFMSNLNVAYGNAFHAIHFDGLFGFVIFREVGMIHFFSVFGFQKEIANFLNEFVHRMESFRWGNELADAYVSRHQPSELAFLAKTFGKLMGLFVIFPFFCS